MKYNTQICTAIHQSERLIKLGLKEETADMHITNMSAKGLNYVDNWQIGSTSFSDCKKIWKDIGLVIDGTDVKNSAWEVIPAWSLHRLISLMPDYIHLDGFEDTKYCLTLRPYCLLKVSYKQDSGNWLYGSESSNLFDAIIDVIEYLILEKHFDKQYLN